MDKIDYLILDDRDGQEWDRLGECMEAMYSSLESQGWPFPLAEGGAEMWLKPVRNTIGRFGRMVVAKANGSIIGFAHGMIKFLPDYLGGHAIGFVTHIYVDNNYRETGTGRRMVEMLEEWFRQKKVHSIELQVITGNTGGIDFWKKLGYLEELRQYRKTL